MLACSSVVIAIGFYGNETANKGLERSVGAASDIVDTVTLIRNQVIIIIVIIIIIIAIIFIIILSI